MMREECVPVLEDLSAIVDGDEAVLEKHLDHLADCDSCRDARHDASDAAKAVAAAGDDYVVPGDLAERVLAAIERDRPAQAAPATAPASDPANSPARPDARQSARTESAPRAPGARSRLIYMAAAAAAVVAIGGVAISKLASRSTADHAVVVQTDDRSAAIAHIERAGQDGESGVLVRAAGADRFVAAAVEAPIGAGSVIRTDARTRAWLQLPDGTEIVLNHNTELAFAGDNIRAVTLATGEIVADIVPVTDGDIWTFAVPTGRVDVLGTRFSLTATDDFSSVRVTRGLVRFSDTDGDTVEVRPGEEGTTALNTPPSVEPVIDLAGSVAWSEIATEADDRAESMAGIGELRAFKPGEERDRDWPMALAKHKVTVRIVGNVARTEIVETFRNDSDVTLEGVYKFPLPPDAKIDRLALDVKDAAGGFEDGAFIDKRRAQKIWAGVIDNAAPKQRIQRDELIWVPGPWRDPALLEWQSGGRFELRIFPIPAKGERTVKIGYTQTIRPFGAKRRYVYPLAHSADGSTAVEKFDVDVKVSGADPNAHIDTFGYDLVAAPGDSGTTLAMSEERFVPKGNLVVEYQLPDTDKELRAWTFQGDVVAAPADDKASAKAAKAGGADPDVTKLQKDLATDVRPAVVMAIRPELPRWTEAHARDYVLLVDSSQSMVGERYTRASALAAAMVGEMDRRDRFMLVACDVTCDVMADRFQNPTAKAARQAQAWLDNIPPAGASDLARSLRYAARAPGADRDDARDTWVVYFGDGLASTGQRRAGGIAAQVDRIADEHKVSVTTVGIGGDADEAALSAIARLGGGHFVPYVPGQRIGSTALSVLETTYGVSLRNATVQLPAGLDDVAPAVLPTVRSGDELIIAARFTGDVTGNVVLRGTVGGKPYVQKYAIDLVASTAAGNAFVPRVWAALEIDRLETAGGDTNRIVALSKGYGVLSKQTSLLVLESDAMFKAFGVDRAQPTMRWTGEDEAEVIGADAQIAYRDPSDKNKKRKSPGKSASESAAYGTTGATKAPKADFDLGDDFGVGFDGGGGGGAPRGRRGGGRWMKRVYYDVAAIGEFTGNSDKMNEVVGRFEQELIDNPDSREKHRALVQALSYSGDLKRAYQVATQWLERDKLDPQALTYMADILGRQGNRDDSLRLLSGIVDIDPDNTKLQTRLAEAYDLAGDTEHACSHRTALAELTDDAKVIGAAVRCQRALGDAEAANDILAAISTEALRKKVDKAAAIGAATANKNRSQLSVDATWEGGSDLDISIVTPQGTRLSWMGGRDGIVVTDTRATKHEKLAIAKIKRGNYLVEVSRTKVGDTTPIAGTLVIDVHGTKRTLAFELTGDTVVVGRLAITTESRLVEQ